MVSSLKTLFIRSQGKDTVLYKKPQRIGCTFATVVIMLAKLRFAEQFMQPYRECSLCWSTAAF